MHSRSSNNVYGRNFYNVQDSPSNPNTKNLDGFIDELAIPELKQNS